MIPAFMQPPDPGGLKWTEVPTPDALDMLITSRNHDLTSQIAADAAPQDWILALVSLQTMEGFGGRATWHSPHERRVFLSRDAGVGSDGAGGRPGRRSLGVEAARCGAAS